MYNPIVKCLHVTIFITIFIDIYTRLILTIISLFTRSQKFIFQRFSFLLHNYTCLKFILFPKLLCQ